MQTLDSVEAARAWSRACRNAGESVALVPTMGNLHAGHLSLVTHAAQLARRVVVSIFVNPLQFGPQDDFVRYPRTPEQDDRLLRERGVDGLFVPTVADMYPAGLAETTRVEVPGLSDLLCGVHRPGHFVGVATVVVKLFNAVQPDLAVFGEKDFQQLLLIRKMATDLNIPTRIVGVPTVREADGLALSSRNRYLGAEERKLAPRLWSTLRAAAGRLESGDADFQGIEGEGLETLRSAGLRPDYFAVRHPETLARPGAQDCSFVVLAAAWLGTTRLIDNCRVRRKGAGR
jgi:pantoate--beta-alanine ligase